MTNAILDTEDKRAWVEWGNSAEAEAIAEAREHGLAIEPRGHKYKIDAAVACDIKTRCTPFRMAPVIAGIPSRYAVTLNTADVERYPKRTLILFNVQYPAIRGQWIAWLDDLMARQPKVHEYKNRVDDTVNKRASYVLDLRWMKCLWFNEF